MQSLRDAAFVVRPTGTAEKWSMRDALARPIWPAVTTSTISTQAFVQRFAPSGKALRTFAAGTTNLWTHMDRAQLVEEMRDRLRDPVLVRQRDTQLCGPAAIVFQLIVRHPQRYVQTVRELIETGEMTTFTDEVIEAAEDLRGREIPDLAQVDWLLLATLRDDANVMDDIDDGEGLEAYTLWGGMRDWTRDVLGLAGNGWETCLLSGEADVMRKLRDALVQGGVAFLLVDSNLLTDGGDDDEEEIGYQEAVHNLATAQPALGPRIHSEDDAFPPDHWVALLSGLELKAEPADEDTVSLRVWCWGAEYEITGTVEALGEYLYAGVWGFP